MAAVVIIALVVTQAPGMNRPGGLGGGTAAGPTLTLDQVGNMLNTSDDQIFFHESWYVGNVSYDLGQMGKVFQGDDNLGNITNHCMTSSGLYDLRLSLLGWSVSFFAFLTNAATELYVLDTPQHALAFATARVAYDSCSYSGYSTDTLSTDRAATNGVQMWSFVADSKNCDVFVDNCSVQYLAQYGNVVVQVWNPYQSWADWKTAAAVLKPTMEANAK